MLRVVNVSDDDDDGLSYFCAWRGSALLGSFDGVDWSTLRTAAIGGREEHWKTEVHQSLHRRFQNSTPWGMLARVAVDVAVAGVDSQRLLAIARFCHRSAKTVQETYATYLSLAGDRDRPPLAGR